MKFQIHRTYSLNASHPEVRRAIIVVHGTSQNPDTYFGHIIRNTEALGITNESMVIAPFFKEIENTPAADDLYWSTGWRSGNLSQNAGTRYSSFDVVDFLLTRLSDRTLYPNLQQITLVGHSAGGQYVHRYTVGTQVPSQMTGYRFSFVVANPSSYAYLIPERPVPGSTTTFALPDASSCSGYNTWGFGLNGRNSYMTRLTAGELIAQYLSRPVTYLSGGADTVRDSNLDTTCSADLQGPNRNARARAYSNHIEKYFPQNNHQFVEVAGVGHSASGMFGSSAGRAVIFPALTSAPAPTTSTTTTTTTTTTTMAPVTTTTTTLPAPVPATDTISPSVRITSPTSSYVSRSITLAASATDNLGVVSMSCIVDGRIVKTVSNVTTISCPGTLSRGWHTLKVTAKDAAGNVGSASMRVRAR